MKYVVKDLMINVLPLTQKILPSGGCDAGACTSACSGCTPCSGGCSPCSDCSKCSTSTPGDILDWISHVYDPVVLGQLKEQLKVVTAGVEAREKAMYQAMRPTTETEIEMLKGHLKAALQELDKLPKQVGSHIPEVNE
jgi:hypothetical protein